ncbi:hypothetical protein A3862_27350 [Methylobacterium sp. XJLW]|uniref:hypothetical protein n=1 Tax=Methylobacterium sp. XJLW TaxID=739141 RepID=UPI000DAAF23E|nr:hypothetical protein [Methylobacterium sp. XJLW]AWV18798.1 hypothetical protein A3862_27350 [Methylobacterium sp. XJLW]
MLVLFWTSTIPNSRGGFVAFPIGVSDPDLETFCERLTREGGVMVTRLQTERRDDGYAYIVDEEAMFVSIAGTATVRNNNTPVRREVDEVTA